ncbi:MULTISPECIES: metal ABC transporter substrate-binding protein [Haloferacaceae]|uniref:Metal ABC transporter substrate-binding protein n=1 Tax=Halorubrum glutamatedens TaxID=2707018 RepID=A0ABD5QW54_9EURY|nr:zinc ABC transporter substrate-binding protein [Halobellus captivus]
MDDTRRSVLRRSAGLLGVGAAGSLAGCAGTGGGSDAGDGGDGEAADGLDSGYAMFFPLHDWANRVAGDHATFTNPVDVGQLGHGWEPSGTLAADVASTDAFVYFDSAEFTWAQDLASTLESDYEDVAVIDGLSDLDEQLLAWDHGRESHEEEGHDEEGGGDDHDHEEEDDHDGEDEHDHGSEIDPHVWVDPVLATEVVDTIAGGLGDVDPDNADDYVENAEAYKSDLDEVDEAFSSLVDDAERDVVVLAGHDSFQYLSERYGFEIHSPVGVSPQNEPSGSDIADTIEVVDENGIDVVLHDRFESSNLAETIVEDSGASETMAVTAVGGSTREWNEAGYGYREQMLEVNVPAFGRALGAE